MERTVQGRATGAADPVAEMRTALVNAAAEHRHKQDFEYWSDEEVADFALAEIRREREELAKAVCADCRCSYPLTTDGELNLRHYILDPNGQSKILTSHCSAAAIHARSREGEK